jgi:GNAT superfamily N-acetyltransferase
MAHRAPSELLIRPQEERDAAAGAALRREADDTEVISEAGWLSSFRRSTPRLRRLALAAELDGAVVAMGRTGLNTATTTAGAAWLRVEVAALQRRQGIGSALHERLFDHLLAIDATEVTAFIRWTEEAERWAAARGWRRKLTAPLIALDPRGVPEPDPPAGFSCVSARAFGRKRAVFELTRIGIIDEPGPVPNDDLRYEDWLDEWNDPDLDHDATTLVVQGDLPVTFAYIKIAGTRAQHAGTATHPSYRGRGLASAAKRHALRVAAAKGVTQITTSNAEENVAMRAINRKLGFEPIGEHVILGRSVALA